MFTVSDSSNTTRHLSVVGLVIATVLTSIVQTERVRHLLVDRSAARIVFVRKHFVEPAFALLAAIATRSDHGFCVLVLAVMLAL